MPADSDTDTVPGTDIYYTHDIQVRYILYMYSGYYKNVITFKYNESDCFLYSYWVRVCGTCTTSTSNLYPGTHTQQ